MAKVDKSSSNALAELSSKLSDAVERASSYIVAIHARRRIPSSGIVWRDGTIVSASHTVRRDGTVRITLPDGRHLAVAVFLTDSRAEPEARDKVIAQVARSAWETWVE